MKDLKRLIAALLALVLCVGQIPATVTPAHAAGSDYSVGLDYALSEDGKSYIVTGIGSCTDTDLVIPATYNGLPVTEIGNDAFYGCYQLTSVVLPDSITSIGRSAFMLCAYMTDVTLPEGLLVIGGAAFNNCVNLTSIELPSTVSQIDYSAFWGCNRLGSVVIPANVTVLGAGAFALCSALTEIIVEDGNKYFCSVDGVVYTADLKRLVAYPVGKSDSSYTIPAGTESINSSAFAGCRDLQSITISEGVTYIGGGTFWDCANLTNIVIPNGVSCIESETFLGCGSLTSITIPASVTSIESRTFCNCQQRIDIYYAGSADQWNNIYKSTVWNHIDWNGNVGDFVVHYGVDCEANGHTWTEATCTTPKICICCGLTDGEPLGHQFVDGICSNCGTVNYDGKVVRIYSPYADAFITTYTEQWGDLDAGASDEAVLWTVQKDENGYYSFCYDGMYLAASGGKYSLTMYNNRSNETQWELVAVDGGYYLRNMGVVLNGFAGEYEDQYLAYSGSVFTSIGFNEANAEQYIVQLIVATDCEIGRHSWTEATCQQERYCTVCGIYGGMGDHDYVDGICSVCGDKCSVGLEYTLSDDGTYYIVTGIGTCTDTELVIPATYNGLPVTKIGKRAFWNRNELISVTLPDSITAIGQQAFGACYRLRRVVLNEGLLTIGGYAFQDCMQLESVNLPASLTEIAYGAFAWCYALRQIHIPANVSSIGNQAFAWCPAMESFTVAEDNEFFCAVDGVLYDKTMTRLIYYPAAKSETSFQVPGTVTRIATNAFTGCENLEEVILTENLLRIEDMAFEQCSNLQSIQLPAKLVFIGFAAFRYCHNLTGITIPAGVTHIGESVFAYCTNLTEILVEEGSSAYCSMDGVLYTADMSQLVTYPAGKADASFTIPADVTWIAAEAFCGSHSLQQVLLAEGVTRINYSAFTDCTNLTGITIPASVTYLGSGILINCSSLKTVIYQGTTEQWDAIEKAERWNEIDWQGNTWDALVRCVGECKANGHTWAEATCTEPATCANCGLTDGDAMGHFFVNDICIRCSALDYVGKVVEIYSPYGDSYLSANVGKWGYINATNEDEAAFWTITMDEDGYYYFSSNGQYLAAEGGKYALALYSNMNDWCRWEVIPADGGYYLRGVNAYQYGYPGDHMYNQGSNFTTLSFNEKNAPRYVFQLIPVSACEAYGHSWTDADCQQERVCTVCGISGGMGLHQYNTKGFCDLCGTRYSLGLDYMLEGNYYVVTGMGSCTDSELIIPNNYNGLPVAKIGAEAFWNRNELISVTVPGTVTVIEPGAFGACYQLQNVYLSEGVEVIGRYAFQDCSRLTNINIPSTVKEIKDDAFSWCSELRSIHLPAGLVTLGNTVFYYCQNLQQITVDADNANYCAVDGVLYTKDMTTLLLYPAAKEGASFAVPSTVTIIGNAAFANNRNLTEVILQEGVVNIGAQAFQDCRNLRNVVLPSTLTAISYNAFRSCAISTITIPARVSKISNGIFAGCENLTEILVEQGSVSYCSVDGVWYTADMTTLLTYPAGKSAASFAIPEGVNSLYVESFNGCQYLQEVIFPASLTSISNSAFQSCGSLTAVVLPEGVTRIENYAFNDCYNLQSITIPAGVTYLGNRMLGYCNRLTNVYYMGTIAQWESIEKANQWNMIDWNGKTWDSLVRFCGECNINGHNWQAATCTAPKTCANCAMTEGTALGHDYVDDACIRCGMMNYDGKVVKIYSPYGQSYLGITSHKDGMILSVAEDEAALWTMIQDEDGYYAFSWEGYYLAADGGNYTLGLYSRMTERTKWELIPVDGGFYLRHIYAYQNGWNGEYLYFYSSVFTSLSLNEKHLEQFVFHLIPASACDVNGHVLSEGNCQQDIFCTVCGLFCGKGDHQYVGTVCVVCGDEHVSEGLEYRLSDDRRSYIVVGIGSCMDSLLIIPATYNGLPVVRIEDGAFEYCQQLTSVILPEGLQSIGWSAFRNCNNLKQVQLPDSLTEIEGWAFAYCGQLEDICIPAGVTEYRTYTFIGCYSLERIAVSAANPALTEQDGVLYTKDMSTLLFYPVGKQDNRFVVPDSVTAINGSAFGGCNNLTAIELPEGLREIGYGAFSGAGLKTVKIPSTVTYIGMYAFENNYNLTTVTIPAGVTFVGNGAFMECENLVEIVVDQQNTSYCAVDGVLYTKNGKNIVSYPAGKVGTAFVVPEGVKTINAHAFQGCHLTEVVLSNGVTTIDGLAFQHCHELERVTIPMTVKTIRNWAFGGSNRLTEFLYAGGEASWNAIEKEQGWDEAIGEYHVVFYAFCREGHTLVEASCSAPKHCLNCDYAEGDVLPHNYVNGVCIYCGEVDHGAVFAQGVCGDNITWALYEDGHLALTGFGFMYDYGYDDYSAPWLVYADQIKTLHIGDDITYIGHYAFIYLTGLTEVIIPADVEYVGNEAFAYCTGLERLYVFGLQSCGFRLFKGCTNLKDVFFFNLNMDMTLMYFCQRTALEDTVERLYLLADLINISDSEFCAFTCTNKPEYVHVGDYEMIMFTKGNHSWQTVIDEEPTCYEWGSAYDVCTVCGAEGNWTELLPMHHYNEDYICVLCGRMPAYVVCCGLQKNDLIKGEDGVYRTAEGQEVLIAVSASLEVLEGLSLADFVEAYSDDLDMESWYKLLAVTNEDGYAPMTDETYGWFLAVAFEYLLEEEEAYISVFLGFYVDRNCDHVWKEATCSSPKTCVNCGCVEGGTVDHRYENGFCTMCGKEEPVQIIAGGICGDNVYWELTGNGVLTFTGFGPMYEGSMNGPETPWMQYADMVREVYIEEGITRLTHYAFAYFTKLTTITVPASVEQISCGAFLDCTGLQSAVLYNAHNAFTNSFKGCVNLTDVYVLDAYMVGKNPSSYFESIGLTTYAQRVYMLASLGNFHEEFARDFSCWMVPEIVNLDGVEYIMYTKQAHDMKQVESAAPGCETEGYITSKCETCGYVSTEYISATGHQYDDTYVCTLCGDAPKYIPFGKLQLKDMILGKDGVYYTAEGHMVMIAVKAPLEWLGGKSLFDYVEDYGNTYFGTTYWKQLVEATNEDGYAALTKKTYTWILDVIAGNPAWGESENDLPNYLALQLDRSNIHTHQYNAVVIAPTCTDYGYTIYVCACGEKYIDNIVPSVDHKDEDDDGICDYGCGTVLKPGPDTLIITAESVKVMNGNWATITLLVEQNPGFQGMSLYPVIKDANGNTVNWVWEADVTNGQLGFDMNVGTMVVLTADANSTNTGVLLEMMFYVGEEVELGDYTISFRLYKGECFNDRGDVVYVSLPTVTVTVHDVVYGDVNGDGNIDIRDVLLLRQYLANRDPNTGESPVEVEPGADANGDGNIDIRDVLLMRQYLANRDPDTGESPIVLGP